MLIGPTTLLLWLPCASTPLLSVQVNLTATSVLFQPNAFAGGVTVEVMSGPVVSQLTAP